jgi:hypothetical protein
MRAALLSHLLLTLILLGIAYYSGQISAMKSVAIGSILSLSNILVLFWGWKQILQKKRMDLSVGIIVCKYPTLGFIIYEIIHHNWVEPGWFVAGFSVILPVALATAYWIKRTD